MQSSFNEAGTLAAIRILQIAKELRRHWLLGYSATFAAIGLASLFQWLVQSQYDGAPFLTIYPAVIIVTLIGGLGPGLLSALLAGISQFWLFIPAFHWFAVISYAFDATLCVLLIVFINRTLDLLLINIGREKQAKQHQSLLATELHHRIQNLLTVIQAVVRFSLPGNGPVQASEIRQRLMDRIQSMAAANRAITDSMGNGVRLLDLIESEVRGLESQFEIGGATGLALGTQMTQDFSLILHELVTNALKYGALSLPQGRVSIQLDWAFPVFTFTWQEHNGPAVTEPSSSGFGSQILQAFARSLGQRVETTYAQGGFRYLLQVRSEQIKCLEPGMMSAANSHAPAGNSVAIEEPPSPRTAPARETEFEH